MGDITVTHRKVKALNAGGAGGQIPGVFPYTAGGAGNIGDSVYIANDGDVEVTDADSAGTSRGIGVVVAIGTEGATSFVAGDRVAVARVGVRVAGYSGATPGALAYVSGTAGRIADAAGGTSRVIGQFESATVLYVNPPA